MNLRELIGRWLHSDVRALNGGTLEQWVDLACRIGALEARLGIDTDRLEAGWLR